MIGSHEIWNSNLPDIDSGIMLPESRGETGGCTFPFKQLVVDYEGDILPCCKMGGKQLALGNIESMTLRAAWESSSMRDLQAMHKANRWRENAICNRCITGNG